MPTGARQIRAGGLPIGRASYGWQANRRRLQKSLPSPLSDKAVPATASGRRTGFQPKFGQTVAEASLLIPCAMETAKRIVYILKNDDNPPRYYTGVTRDLGARLEAHNAGRCPHT